MVELKQNEKIEDLCCDGLKIIQSANEYRFTSDAVLLANFCKDMQGKLCIEFGTGSGVISILVAHKKKPKRIVAIEIQPQLADMAKRSVLLNGMDEQIQVVCGDAREATKFIDKPADVVVCNPPYRRIGSGERQLAENLAICRHELKLTLAEMIQSASKTLNNKGVFYMVHQADRLCEIITQCSVNSIAVKEILPVCPEKGKDPNVVLIRGIKCGQPDCKLLAAIVNGD